MTDDRRDITEELVVRLIADQFPQWAGQPVTKIQPGGWSNHSFRLGTTMIVRLPSAERYIAQVEKEQLFLPHLAASLPLPIPSAIAIGKPSDIVPWPFGIYGWIDGETATIDRINDVCRFAEDLAGVLLALNGTAPTGGPVAGAHNFHRGGDLRIYDGETRSAVAALAEEIEGDKALDIWEAALSSRWDRPPVWLHGDVAPGNLLVKDGHLCAVIDFGSMAIGDPACDLVIAWTFFSGESRRRFRAALPFDRQTWQRGRGWALWKALITLQKHGSVLQPDAINHHHALSQIMDDPVW